MEPCLLHRYRHDRRKLLEFLLLSAGFDGSSLSDVDFDALSVDYIVHRLRSGGTIDIAQATEQYFDESEYPIAIKDYFFLVSSPDLAGSPPRRMPPQADLNPNASRASTSLDEIDNLITEKHAYAYKKTVVAPMEPVDTGVHSLGLPTLITGLSDDDLQETAYEVLLASMVFSGIELHAANEKKKEKSSKLFSGMKSRKNKMHLQSQPIERHLELIDFLRTQMQISEANDACIRQRLIVSATSRTCQQPEVPQISIALLDGIHESNFVSEKQYRQWRRRQVNVLEEFICSCKVGTNDHQIARSSLAKIRDVEEGDFKMSASHCAEALLGVRQLVLRLSSLPGEFGLENETYHWTAAYHLNIRIYEKLLFSIFDILDEGQLVAEAEEILMLIKMTWFALGITQKMHDAMLGWVFFQQFVKTHEPLLLEHAILKLQRFVSVEDYDLQEEQYMNSLICSWQHGDTETELSLVLAIFSSISCWCDNRLQDYHLHFSKEPCIFGGVMKLLSLIGVPITGDLGKIKLLKLDNTNEEATRKLRTIVDRSIEAAYTRVANTLDLESKLARMHGLALLASELNSIAKREFSIFYPVLRNWYPEAGAVAAAKLKKFYGERLQPYLMEVSYLTEDVKSVLSAANTLDYDLSDLYSSTCKENKLNHLSIEDLDHYQIEEITGPIILDWIIAQQSHILQWTKRVVELEEWESLSFQQRQAPSIVEVFRIIEETVDQFFGWNLPMNITHLQALLAVIFHSLDAYLLRVSDGLVDKKLLLPSAPPLTRYTETVMPVIKRKMVEIAVTNDDVNDKLAASTMSKLCIRLNTLQYIKKQGDTLEEALRKAWALVRSSKYQRSAREDSFQSTGHESLTYDEAVDELFSTTFNIIKESSTNAMGKICDLIGLRAVFWDMRDTVLACLYHGNVESARLDKFLPQFDTVLDRLCGLLSESLRDLAVLSVYRASMDAFVWVLLDGGPSRAFSESDVSLMNDDLSTLKEFFIADGEGLPRSLVEKEAKFAEQILQLFSFKTHTVIQMLLNASERISSGLDLYRHSGNRDEASILIRILCHKKDREASHFLKRHYHLPVSSEYDDALSKDSSPGSAFISDILERSSSFRLSSFKKKILSLT